MEVQIWPNFGYQTCAKVLQKKSRYLCLPIRAKVHQVIWQIPPLLFSTFRNCRLGSAKKRGGREQNGAKVWQWSFSYYTIQSPPSPKLCSTLEKFSPPPLRRSHVCRRLLSTLYTTELFWFLLTIHTALLAVHTTTAAAAAFRKLVQGGGEKSEGPTTTLDKGKEKEILLDFSPIFPPSRKLPPKVFFPHWLRLVPLLRF